MALADLFTRSRKPAVKRPSVVRTVREARGVPDADEYAFRLLTGGVARNDLPPMFIAQILRDSHWMYESHGLAERIVERVASLIIEAGATYTIEFLPSFEEKYPEYAKLIRTRLENWWYSKEADMPARTADALRELLLSGEHGWRFRVEPNGWVGIGDFTRYDVRELKADAFDKRRLACVQIESENGGEPEELEVLHASTDTDSTERRHLEGECVYMRLKTRASKMRGRPLLQAAIDELRNEKRFRVLSTDRAVTRMGTFIDIAVEGDEDEVEAVRAEYEDRPPENGRAFVHNKQVEADFKSGKIEAAELADMYRTNATIIVGFFGLPISWFGYGDGSTRATSETQQDPAVLDYKAMREGLLSSIEDVLYFVVDQAILSGYIGASRPDHSVTVTTEEGAEITRLIRDCVTINVSVIPVAPEQRAETPLAATMIAQQIISTDSMRTSSGDEPLFNPEQALKLLNYALAYDGTGIEINYVEPDAAGAPTQQATQA